MALRGGRRVKSPLAVVDAVLELWDDGCHQVKGKGGILDKIQKLGIKISRGGIQAILAKHGRHIMYSKETIDKIRPLLLTGMTHEQIGAEIGKRTATVDGVSSLINVSEVAMEPMPDQVKYLVDERLAAVRGWKPGRYMIVADFHIKFHSMEALQQLLSIKGDFDGCVIAGDFLDEFWISHFRKDNLITYSQELAVANIILEKLVKRFGRVLYLHGNHEDRRWKQLLEVSQTIISNIGNNEAVTDVYAIIEKMRHWFYNKVSGVTVFPGWFVDICNGKIIVSHPDRFMAVPGNAAKNVVEHMYNNSKTYRLNGFDALLMGHPHRLDGPKHRIGVWTWELPSMCPILPYQISPKASNAGTIDTGYSIITTRPDGTLIFNESRSYLVNGWR